MGYVVTIFNISFAMLGWIIGLISTFIGIKYGDRVKKRNIAKGLYNEVRENKKKAEAYQKLIHITVKNKYVPFKTSGYEQYKLSMIFNEKSFPKINDILANAYISAELFNQGIDEYKNNQYPEHQIELLKNIEENMFKIYLLLNDKIKDDKL